LFDDAVFIVAIERAIGVVDELYFDREDFLNGFHEAASVEDDGFGE
jgi:hypothetical protein